MTANKVHFRPLFLVSPSPTPCGVEMFTRRLYQTWRDQTNEGQKLEVSGAIDIGQIWRSLATADAIVLSFPVVAWKKSLALPLLAFIAASLRGRMTVAIIHEWNDLNWLRRLFISVYVIFAQRLLFSSPHVRKQFTSSLIGYFRNGFIVVVPPNMRRPAQLTSTTLSTRIEAERAPNKILIGHFGSIYPKKRSDFVLDIAAELKRRGKDVFVVFVGSFIKASDNVEGFFWNKVAALGLTEVTMVTGYVRTETELFSILASVDVVVYSFTEGLTSRRSSVLACLQSGRPVVVNAPGEIGELEHHSAYCQAIETGVLRLVPTNAPTSDYADAIETVTNHLYPPPLAIFEEFWQDAARSFAIALDGSKIASPQNASRVQVVPPGVA